ncbi:uromodulin-like [Mixophyes fleayi]|uniref:uromodulin-like n=1 Tax=Mixophyes fleayi TaxID=3061075 RepID=UPI003F4D771E
MDRSLPPILLETEDITPSATADLILLYAQIVEGHVMLQMDAFVAMVLYNVFLLAVSAQWEPMTAVLPLVTGIGMHLCNAAQEDSSIIYITNTLYIDPVAGPLIIKNPINYNFTCAYNLTMQTSLNFSLHPVLSTITLTPENGTSVFTVKMAAYRDVSCTDAIQQDETVDVGSDVYLGLFSPDADGDVFALRVDTCLATPSNNRSDTNSVQLVSGGSAADDGVLTTVVKNGVSLEALIKIGSFAFQGYPEVYIFCDVDLCNKTNGCSGSRSGRSADSKSSGLGINLLLQDDVNYASSGYHTAASWAVLASSLLAYLTFKLF